MMWEELFYWLGVICRFLFFVSFAVFIACLPTLVDMFVLGILVVVKGPTKTTNGYIEQLEEKAARQGKYPSRDWLSTKAQLMIAGGIILDAGIAFMLFIAFLGFVALALLQVSLFFGG